MPAISPDPIAPAAPVAPAQALADACAALWLATLSLMTAFMQTGAPAHRYLLARRIARNLGTLRQQECFSADCRERFARLALRWEDKARECGPERGQPQGGQGVLAGLWRGARGAI